MSAPHTNRDPEKKQNRGILIGLVAILLVGGLLYWMLNTSAMNSASQGIPTQTNDASTLTQDQGTSTQGTTSPPAATTAPTTTQAPTTTTTP